MGWLGCTGRIAFLHYRFIFPLLDLWMAVEKGGMSKYETLKNFEDPLIEPLTILMFRPMKQM